MSLARRLVYFTASFTLGLAALAALSLQAGLFEVRRIPIEVSVDGDEGYADEAADGESVRKLRARLTRQIASFQNHKIWEIDISDLQALIRKDEWVKRVAIKRNFPNEIQVKVTAKQPVLLLVTGKGKIMPVTEDAHLLSALDPAVIPDVPLLRGENLVDDEKLRRKVVEFARQLPESGPLSRKNIAEISYTPEDGYRLVLMSMKMEVKMGEEKTSTKVARVTQVLDYLAANNLKGRVIDASFSKKVLVRLRKDP